MQLQCILVELRIEYWFNCLWFTLKLRYLKEPFIVAHSLWVRNLNRIDFSDYLQMGCQKAQDGFTQMSSNRMGIAGRWLCLPITIDKSTFVGLLQKISPRVVELLHGISGHPEKLFQENNSRRNEFLKTWVQKLPLCLFWFKTVIKPTWI